MYSQRKNAYTLFLFLVVLYEVAQNMITYKFLLLLILLAKGPVLIAESKTFRLWPQDAPGGDINGDWT